MTCDLDRRVLLGAGAFVLAATSNRAAAATPKPLPHDFLWGAATAAHQVEGNNVNSDFWLLEHLTPTPFREPSGDACDSWNRHLEDIALVARLGLNAYRFSVEWARVEPERAHFSQAMLAYYKGLARACRERGIAPIVTYNHFTLPRWAAALGGWEAPELPELFARYCDRLARALGLLPAAHCTINEANQPLLPYLLRGGHRPPGEEQIVAAAAKACGSTLFGSYGSGDPYRTRDAMLAAHHLGGDAIRAAVPGAQVGITLALQALDAAPGGETLLARVRAETRTIWYEAVRHDAFVGVQSYERVRIGASGSLPPLAGVPMNDEGADISPDVLDSTISEVALATGRPVIVTEHGVNTANDVLRQHVIDQGVAAVRRARASGIDVRGYIHWSLLDNFEWLRGFKPRFGLCAVDRTTFIRTPKPSAYHLGRVARMFGNVA